MRWLPAQAARILPGMTVLRVKQTWKREKPAKKPGAARPIEQLTPDEQTNVRKALRVLRTRYRTLLATAEALETSYGTIERVSRGRRKPTAGLAIRVARAAGVPVDDVLSGAFPEPGACPMCGRLG